MEKEIPEKSDMTPDINSPQKEKGNVPTPDTNDKPQIENPVSETSGSEISIEKHIPKVFTVRDWKEYVGESLLIVFSVLLALFLTEYFGKVHDKENTRSLLKEVVQELSENRRSIQEMKQYNLLILANIDSSLADKNRIAKIVSNDEFNLKIIIPEGALYRYMKSEAWSVAKSNNIIQKLDFQTLALLTRVYGDLDRMMKVEEEVAKVYFSRESRDPRQVHASLILIRDIYHAWAVDRSDGLIQSIDSTIMKVKEY